MKYIYQKKDVKSKYEIAFCLSKRLGSCPEELSDYLNLRFINFGIEHITQDYVDFYIFQPIVNVNYMLAPGNVLFDYIEYRLAGSENFFKVAYVDRDGMKLVFKKHIDKNALLTWLNHDFDLDEVKQIVEIERLKRTFLSEVRDFLMKRWMKKQIYIQGFYPADLYLDSKQFFVLENNISYDDKQVSFFKSLFPPQYCDFFDFKPLTKPLKIGCVTYNTVCEINDVKKCLTVFKLLQYRLE